MHEFREDLESKRTFASSNISISKINLRCIFFTLRATFQPDCLRNRDVYYTALKCNDNEFVKTVKDAYIFTL